MTNRRRFFLVSFLASLFAAFVLVAQAPPADDASRLISAALGPSPLEENLRKLTDEVGGRVPGTEGNRRGVAWAIEAFRQAGVDEVHTEKFTMPTSWSEGATRLEILSPVPFQPRAVSIAWSPATPAGGIEAPVLDLHSGTEADFARAASQARGALLLVHNPVLRTWADLFNEYAHAPPVIERALKAGAAGILWMASREQGVLYRHQNSFDGQIDRIPQALVAREDAQRMSRFIAAGKPVRARLVMPNRIGGPIEVENVVAEIRGGDKADEIVMLGAHLDSWELGSGALDNGCNSALTVEVARAIRAAGVRPRRTVRFVLWNGEEQGLLGSWAYARAHRAELDRIVAYVNFDGGIGHVTGYSLGGRKELLAPVSEVLAPVASWGMNEHTLDASGGTDHVDFMLEGVPTLSANQVEGNYLPNYHATSDTMDKVDIRELKLHAAYAAVTIVGIANRAARLAPRQTRAEIEVMLKQTGFEKYLKDFGMWDDWVSGRRGRQP